MKFIYILTVISALFCISFKAQNKNKLKEVVVDLKFNDKDTCFNYIENNISQKVYREIEILENKLADTTVIGFAAIHPAQLGKFIFIQGPKDPASSVYIGPGRELNQDTDYSYSEIICAARYLNGKMQGSIKLKLRVLIPD